MHSLIRPRLLLVAATLLLIGAPFARAQATFKVGVFDPQRVSIETIDGQRAQTDLQTIQNAKQQDVSGREAAITAMQQQLSTQALSLSADKRTTLEIEIQRKLLELNMVKDLATRELQLDVAAAEGRFNEKMRQVIEAFASNEEFVLILDAGAVAFAAQAIDVTSAIIEQFDKMFPATTE
jgi:outer membrane protein